MRKCILEAAQTLWDFHCVYDHLSPAEAIIGLGSYDIRVATCCAGLFHDGFAPQIVFSGASGNWTDRLFAATEAEVFRDHAHQLGVPHDAIIVEPNATNIGENLRFSAALMPGAKDVIIVTKPQTQRRCRATMQKQWPDVSAMVTAPATGFMDQPIPHHDKRALICEMVGDTQRMTTYAHLGFQTDVVLPAAVTAAFDTLVAAGFVDHLRED